ncbi:MAG: SDR family oxidoreductase [Actinobacteria bacterium]|nr:SDR family oxidoreductase [Actinomycetota bacterium]
MVVVVVLLVDVLLMDVVVVVAGTAPVGRVLVVAVAPVDSTATATGPDAPGAATESGDRGVPTHATTSVEAATAVSMVVIGVRGIGRRLDGGTGAVHSRYHASMGELEGRVAIVTGSTRGIGRGIAERFAAEGARVVVHGRDAAMCAAVAAELPGAIGVAGDIGAAGFADELIDNAVQQLGRLDIVVNNAGVAIDNFITGVTDERWAATLSTNLTGPFSVLRAAVRVMKGGDGGAVLNVISWAGERGNVGQAAYSASKAGLHALTLTGAKELGKFGIRVNSLSPAVPTDMGAQMDEKLQKISASRRPLKMQGLIADVAEAALFLVSDRSRFITGDVLHVDGGLHLN